MKQELPSGRCFFKKSDLIVVALLAAAALTAWAAVFFGTAGQRTTLQVYSDNQAVFTLDLPAKDQTIAIPGKQLTLELQDNQVRVLTADCPDGICKKTGAISCAGQNIICLPNRVVVQLIGQTTGSQLDAIAE